MTYVERTNITSPLGYTSQANYEAICMGRTALSSHQLDGLPTPFMGSLFSLEDWAELRIGGYSRFEALAIRSIAEAIEDLTIDDSHTLLILSSTKGNIEYLASREVRAEDLSLSESAKRIAKYFGLKAEPLVVCNACISGVAAQVTAMRLLERDHWERIIVTGVDVQSAFICSGFQSFKALSETPCQPFDKDRQGLNLGEAAATIVFTRKAEGANWTLQDGVIRNDATHISAPSRTAEGAYRVLRYLTSGQSRPSLLSVHGTGTPYNDEMESIAIARAHLTDLPIMATKGYYGHTMGAAGVLETILSFYALDQGRIPGIAGYHTQGVSQSLNLSSEARPIEGASFLKIISGFGGCNAGVRYQRISEEKAIPPSCCLTANTLLKTIHTLHLTECSLTIDGRAIGIKSSGRELLSSLYRTHVGDYPKFFKMDLLGRLAFIATELLLRAEHEAMPEKQSFPGEESRAIVFFNHSSSIMSDRAHQESLAPGEAYSPHPSIFVYTLPNITTGEVAIRHRLQSETSFFIMQEKDPQRMQHLASTVLADRCVDSLIYGWVEAESDDSFEADLYLAQRLR